MNSVSFNGLYSRNSAPVNQNIDNQNAKRRNIKKAVAVAAGAAIVAGGTALYINRNSAGVQKAYNTVKDKISGFIESFRKKANTKKPADNAVLCLEGPTLKGLPDKSKDTKQILSLAGGSVAAIGIGATAVSNNIAEEEEPDKKLIVKYKDKEFKGEFRDGIAYDADGEPLCGTLTVINKNEDGTAKKTEITYIDGILNKAFHYSDSEDKIPDFVKTYKNGHIGVKYTGFKEKEEGSGKLIYDKAYCYNVEEESPYPMLCIEKNYDDEGAQFSDKFYKRNLDEDGNIIGKPVHKWSSRFETLSDGTVRKSYYMPEPMVYGDENSDDKIVIDNPIKVVDTKPNGRTEVTLMAINGTPLGKMTLDKTGKAISYRLMPDVDDGKYDDSQDGVIRLKNGKIAGMNDFFNVLESMKKIYSPPRPVKVDNKELSEKLTEKKKREHAQFLTRAASSACKLNDVTNHNKGDIDRVFELSGHTRRIGIKYNEDDTVRAIALYSSFEDFPDCVTLFDENGRPQKDINYSGNGMEQTFSPVYAFNAKS